MTCAFGNLGALLFVVHPGERCTLIYRGHGDMGHGDMPVIRVSTLDYFLNFHRNRMFSLKLSLRKPLFLIYYCLKTIKNLKNN